MVKFYCAVCELGNCGCLKHSRARESVGWEDPGAESEKGVLWEFWKMSVMASFSWVSLAVKERPEATLVPPTPNNSMGC